MNTCIQCKQFSLRDVPKMAELGFGWCPNVNEKLPNGSDSYAVTVSGERAACEKFVRAAETDISQRIIWRNKKRGQA